MLLWFSVIAYSIATGCSLLLSRRGPQRLRLLSLVVGLMSLTRAVSLLQREGYLPVAADGTIAGVHECLVALLCICAIYLLGSEIFERKLMDLKLDLMQREFDTRSLVMGGTMLSLSALFKPRRVPDPNLL